MELSENIVPNLLPNFPSICPRIAGNYSVLVMNLVAEVVGSMTPQEIRSTILPEKEIEMVRSEYELSP